METTPTNAGNGKMSTRTPNRRAASVEPPSSRRSVHTPLDRTAPRDLLNSVRRGTSASGGRRNAPTPHAKAARRALNQRRTALFTPGRNRRRSQVEQRETPQGILRDLGRALAPHSRPIVSSSSPRDNLSSIAPIPEDDEDDELPIDRPRLSLPLDEDDDSDLQPHRSNGLEEENYTVQSIELPRRAISEQPTPRLSRGSFGSVQMSDYFNDNEHSEDIGQQSDFFPGLLEDLQARVAGNDLGYERMDDVTQRTVMGRESDFGLEVPPGLDEQTTFLMSEPGAELAQTSPFIERSVTEAVAAEAGEPYEDVALAGDDDDAGHYDAVSDPELNEADVELDAATAEHSSKRGPKARKKQKRVSRLGIEYPPLPPAFVKRVAQTALQSSSLNNPRISPDTLAALTQASEWFFEQLGDDLGAYASHAKRKTIEESDIMTLMRRQRQISSNTTMFSLAQKHLPRELLQELRMPVPQPAKQREAKRRRVDDTQDATEIT